MLMEHSKLIDELGGTSRVAEMCDLTTGAISQWRTNGIPKPWLKFFKAKRPDLFKSEKKATA
jgi:hypothetical protein